MMKFNQKGITLVETLLAIGILMIILPAIVIALVKLSQQAAYFSVSQRLDSSLALVVGQLSNELTSADSFKVSTSIFDVNPSTVSFVDDNGVVIILSCVDDVVTLPGGDQTIKRLSWQSGATSNWLTDADIDVTNWLASAVRDSSGRLSGLRLQIEFSAANKSSVPLQNAASLIDYTFAIPPSVPEI